MSEFDPNPQSGKFELEVWRLIEKTSISSKNFDGKLDQTYQWSLMSNIQNLFKAGVEEKKWMIFWVEILAGKSCQRKSNERNKNLKREEKRSSHLMFNEWVDQSRFSYLLQLVSIFSLSLSLSSSCSFSPFYAVFLNEILSQIKKILHKKEQ